MDLVEILYGKRAKPKSSLILPEIPKPKGRMVLVAGPPGSGKTTYVNRHKRKRDLVIDLDQIKASLSGSPLHKSPDNPELLRRALFARNKMIKRFASESGPDDTIWLVSGAPKASERRHWKQSAGADVVVLETKLEDVRDRVRGDPSRRGRVDEMESWAKRWWSEYEPADDETVVRPGEDDSKKP